MSYLMGIDVSTTGVKALITSPDGKVIASVNTGQPLSTPRPLWLSKIRQIGGEVH